MSFSSCSMCSNYTCDGCNSRTEKFKPSMTLERACGLVHMLLGTMQCGTNCPDWEFCNLMRMECELKCGRYPLAALAMFTAARYLEIEALEYARSGRFKTLTIEIQADRTAKLLMEQAEKWKEEAKHCLGIPKFHIARTGRGCGAAFMNAYSNVGCYSYSYCNTDNYKLTNCNWDCCDDCAEIEIIPEVTDEFGTVIEPEMIVIPEGRENVPL